MTKTPTVPVPVGDDNRSNQDRQDTKNVDENESESCAIAGFHDWGPSDVALTLIAILAVFYTLYFTRSLAFPIVLAFLLNLVLKPAVLALNRLRIPNVVSAGSVLLAFAGTATMIGILVLEPAQRWMDGAPQHLEKLSDKLRPVQKPLEDLQETTKRVDEITKLGADEEPLQVEEKPPSLASKVLNTTGGFLTGATITVVLLFFLLAAGDRFLEKLVEFMPTWTDKRRIVKVTRDAQRQVSSYLAMISLINVGLGLVIGFGFWLIELPNPLMWGVMAAILNYIPFAGLIVGTATVSLVALASFDSLGQALLAPAIYLVANGVEANFVTPSLIGRSIRLNPVMVILAMFLWGWLWGIGGVLLAIPLLLVFKIYCDHSEMLAPMGAFVEN